MDHQSTDQQEDAAPRKDLDFCPRCGQELEIIIWGMTNCPKCGLHFECC